MTQRSWSERISLAVQDKVYEVADGLTTIVDEALEAFEDVAQSLEKKAKPAYTINLGNVGDLDPNKVAEEVLAELRKFKQPAEQAPSKTGGREITNPTLEETLAVVYDYLRENVRGSDVQRISKESALDGSTSTIAREFKTHIYKKILGVSYFPAAENIK